MQTATYPQFLIKEPRKDPKQRFTNKRRESFVKPDVFIFNKKSSTVVTVLIDQPIYRLTVRLKPDYLRITWRKKSDLQTIFSKNIKMDLSKYNEPEVFWQFKNRTLLINLVERISICNLQTNSSN